MAFLEKLQSHCGGLVRLSTQLYWYGGRGWDSTPGRLCLLLDATPDVAAVATAAGASTVAAAVAAEAAHARRCAAEGIDAHLLIDGRPWWVWVTEKDVELIDETR